jgi:hypothetical protein
VPLSAPMIQLLIRSLRPCNMGTSHHNPVAGGATMKVEEEYEDILQNLEWAVANVYRAKPQLSDYDVMRVYEALIDNYVAEKISRPPKNFMLSPLEQELFDSVKTMCEWRLGRGELPANTRVDDPSSPAPITIDILLLCFKRLLKSAQRWNKSGGPREYLNFMSEYVP